MRALVADDHPVVRRGLAASVSQLGYQCIQVASGAEALREVQRTPPGTELPFDLLVLDHWMAPGPTGLEVIQTLRAGGSRVPIVLCSADPAPAASAEELGAIFLLKQGAEGEELEDVIRDALRRAERWPQNGD